MWGFPRLLSYLPDNNLVAFDGSAVGFRERPIADDCDALCRIFEGPAEGPFPLNFGSEGLLEALLKPRHPTSWLLTIRWQVWVQCIFGRADQQSTLIVVACHVGSTASVQGLP